MNGKTIITTIGVLILATSAFGVETIGGAFGMKLGDDFNPASALSKSALTDGTPMYQFKPDKPFHRNPLLRQRS